ncbi:hypothetical protein A2U01_0001034 [Trifolium medium]|uniref:Cullin-like protein n=1 Tax=Trifolium medium TaxID=97028 RepID=A0A392LZV1_9FABA|nr:hypothetical protein [Trifolium medium]
MEQPVDFEGLKANGFDVKKFFEDQGWMGYFEMLNGPVYPILVKDFWPRCDIIEQVDADREYKNKVDEDPVNNKGKSRSDLGLREFKETEIRSGVSGSEIILTQSNIAQMLKLPNTGTFKSFTPATGKKSAYVERIAQECYIEEDATPTNKVRDMKETQRLLARIMFGSFFPREGGTDQLSWDHRHFIYFLTVGRKMNLAAYIFNHMCKCIRSAQNPLKKTPQIAYPRLLSEIFNQCGLVNRICQAEAYDLLEEKRASFINGNTLVNMKLASSRNLKYPTHPLLERQSRVHASDNNVVLFSNESKEVILEYMRLMKEEGVVITGADIANVTPEDKQKKRKRIMKVKQEKAVEAKTTGNTSASGAEASQVKSSEEKKVTEPEATASEVKTAKEKGKVVKKPRTKKRAERRKLIIDEGSEESAEESLVLKRKRTAEASSEKVQQASEPMKTDADTEILNDTQFRVSYISGNEPEPSHPKLPEAPPVTNPELAKICNNILKRMKSLYQLRYSFTEPYLYLEAWESLRNNINSDLNKIQNGDLNELLDFQRKTRDWVRGVNDEFETAQLKKKGRLSIPNNFFDEDIVKSEIWKDNLGLLDSDLNMHLKFSLQPKTLFVKKDFVENPTFESFKAEVKEELSA